MTITSRARLPNLRRSDLGTLVGCSANNTDLVQPPESVFSVNMLCKSLKEQPWAHASHYFTFLLASAILR